MTKLSEIELSSINKWVSSSDSDCKIESIKQKINDVYQMVLELNELHEKNEVMITENNEKSIEIMTKGLDDCLILLNKID